MKPNGYLKFKFFVAIKIVTIIFFSDSHYYISRNK